MRWFVLWVVFDVALSGAYKGSCSVDKASGIMKGGVIYCFYFHCHNSDTYHPSYFISLSRARPAQHSRNAPSQSPQTGLNNPPSPNPCQPLLARQNQSSPVHRRRHHRDIHHRRPARRRRTPERAAHGAAARRDRPDQRHGERAATGTGAETAAVSETGETGTEGEEVDAPGVGQAGGEDEGCFCLVLFYILLSEHTWTCALVVVPWMHWLHMFGCSVFLQLQKSIHAGVFVTSPF